MSQNEKMKVMVLDDHPIVRQGLTRMINQEKDMEMVADADTTDSAFANWQEKNLDFIIVDISLQESGGLEFIRRIRQEDEDIKLLALSMHDEQIYAERALRMGANGYIMKSEPPEKILEAIRRIQESNMYLSEEMSAKIVRDYVRMNNEGERSPYERLSNREIEVFEYIGKGHPTREIAKQLHLSTKTIDTYRENIKRKLGLDNAAQLVQSAMHWVEYGK